MKSFALAAVLSLAILPLFGDSAKDSAKQGPAYDTATEVDLTGTIVEVREVATGGPLEGVYLQIKTKGEAQAVYVAPTEFVKLFDVKFSKDDQVQVVGSRVTFEGADLILARDVRLGRTTLTVREKSGEPLWKYFLKTVPTGL